MRYSRKTFFGFLRKLCNRLRDYLKGHLIFPVRRVRRQSGSGGFHEQTVALLSVLPAEAVQDVYVIVASPTPIPAFAAGASRTT